MKYVDKINITNTKTPFPCWRYWDAIAIVQSKKVMRLLSKEFNVLDAL